MKFKRKPLTPRRFPNFQTMIEHSERQAPLYFRKLRTNMRSHLEEEWEKGKVLILTGIQSITPKDISMMIKHRKHDILILDDLKALGVKTAYVLSRWRGFRLSLNGLKSLELKAAYALFQWSGAMLYLDGLQALSLELALLIAQWSGAMISLNGLRILSPKAAKLLFTWKGYEIHLKGLKSMDESLAQTMAQWKGRDLYLGQVTDPKILEILSKFKGRLHHSSFDD